MIEIAAGATVPARQADVFAFLAEWQNHWELTAAKIELIELDEASDGPPRGVVRIRGPLGLRRTAVTRVITVREPTLIAGVAELGRRTTAHVRWQLRPAGTRTHVVLAASVASAGPLDRLLLRLGGRVWMQRLFARTLTLLAARMLAAPDRLQAA